MPRPDSYIRRYNRLILGHPRLVILILLCTFAFLGCQIKDFRLDASADSLILEHDEDLQYFRTITERYGTSEFVLVTFTPKQGGLLSDENLSSLHGLRDDLRKLSRVSSVITVLDVPLLRTPPVPLKKLEANIKTLNSPQIDKSLAAKELRESPVFQNLLVSEDSRSTALVVNFIRDTQYTELQKRRTELNEREYKKTITAGEKKTLRRISDQYRQAKQRVNRERHRDILKIRQIMAKYTDFAVLHLGGVPMVSDDMISFVKNDLYIFGLGMVVFLIITLGVIFRRKRWILLPMLCCAFSVISMMGLLGILGLEVTVVSSNFISLQLIITMALAIHLTVRYNELQNKHPDENNRELIRETVRTIFVPCLYTVLTTIAGFCSLMFCDILPVINFGWMMTSGLIVSLLITFLFFPPALLIMRKPKPRMLDHSRRSLTSALADFTDKHGKAILACATAVIVLNTIGITRLTVENSFINYFKSSTEISQGMTFIDKNLGGTTPLDVLIDFEQPTRKTPAPKTTSKPAEPAFDMFDQFSEFENLGEPEDDAIYWYTTGKLETVQKAHNYLDELNATGKVLSLHTVVKLAEMLNGGKELNSSEELALLFKKFPQDFREIVIDPYVSIESNQARISMRIKDSLKSLRRNSLLKQIRSDLKKLTGLRENQIHLSGVMVLYNNMLQSLFKSQIQTIGFTLLALMLMFLVLFRSLTISLIAIIPNLIACLSVLGVMGLANIPLDMMTITIVAICIGIAVDNTIHYIHRFKHEIQEDNDYRAAMHRCHESIGKAMHYTSITIITGFSILALSNFVPTVLFGLLTGLAMAMALAAALTLLPQLILMIKPFPKKSTEP